MRGVALYYMSRAGEAIDAAEQALLHFRDLRDRPQQASVHRLLGAVHRSQSNYAASLEHQTGALDIGKALRDPRMIASAQNNIALIFWELDSFERAYNSFLNVVEYYEAAGPRRNWLQALSNLSLVLIEMGRPDEALTHLLRGQEYAYEDAEVRTRAFYDSNIAFAHEELGDLESAFLYYDRALKVRESVNDLWGQTRVLGAIGGLWWNSRGEADRALPYLERALEKGREAGAAHEQAKVLQLLSEVYEALQQPVRALEVLRQSNTLLESLDVTAVEQQLKVMESAREVAEAVAIAVGVEVHQRVVVDQLPRAQPQVAF
ncbi:MAG: tetratricopeptide repeat protein, partial [Pseudomonadota bacterium]